MKLGKYFYLVLVAFFVSALASCNKTTLQIQRDSEAVLLNKYINKFHKGAIPTSSGLYFIDSIKGKGDSIVAGNYVKVFYRGYLIQDNDTMGIENGTEFDSSGMYEPFGFTVGSSSVIAGWNEAIAHMRLGGSAKWIIPSKDAYAGSPQGLIPAYSTLVFYVTLYKVYRSTDTFKTIQKIPKYFLQ